MGKIVSHSDLEVYRLAFEAAVEVFEYTKAFPKEELYSMTDQVRKASRSVCANLAEAWRKRRYEAAFISKLSDAEGEAAEVQVWIEFAVRFKYLEREPAAALYERYSSVLRLIVAMINSPEKWVIAPPPN